MNDRSSRRADARRPSRWVAQDCWRTAAVAGLVAIVILTGCGLPPAPTGAKAETEMIGTDTGLLKATIAAPSSTMRGVLTRDDALGRAAATISRTDQAREIQAREALLTLESETGEVVTQGRHTWLVTYNGRTFEAEQGCSCHRQTWSNTTVVLDAQTGQVVLVFGTGPPQAPEASVVDEPAWRTV